MKDLIGRSFSIAEGRYRIVDIRQTEADALVFAEPLAAEGSPAAEPGAAPTRAAFHYGDIVPLLESSGAA